jgi:hypothetical protein
VRVVAAPQYQAANVRFGWWSQILGGAVNEGAAASNARAIAVAKASQEYRSEHRMEITPKIHENTLILTGCALKQLFEFSTVV